MGVGELDAVDFLGGFDVVGFFGDDAGEVLAVIGGAVGLGLGEGGDGREG